MTAFQKTHLSQKESAMSLKFGIYLVEQRLISPEQFCGLVKIQQEALATLATMAIRKNMLTIKQVAIVLDQQELTPAKSFVQIAVEMDFLDREDAKQLLHDQQASAPTIRKLAQECGLLTERQCNVLFQHYQKVGSRPMINSETSQPATEPMMQAEFAANGPKSPKFKQKPVIVSQYTSPAN